MKKNSQFIEHFNNILNDLKTTGNLEILMKKYPISSSTTCNMPSTQNLAIGFEKLAFLFLILFTGIILSLIAIIFELKLKPNQRNGQEEVEPSSKEIDELEMKTRRLLEGPLKAKTEKCLKSLLDEYRRKTTFYSTLEDNLQN